MNLDAKLKISLFMYCYKNNLIPSTFLSYYKTASDIHDHFILSSLNYLQEFAYINVRIFSIVMTELSVWISLRRQLIQGYTHSAPS